MPKDYNLDDILNEYSGGSSKASVKHKSAEVQTQTKINADKPYQNTGYIKIPEYAKNADITAAFNINELQSAEKDIVKKPSPSHKSGKFAVSDINRPNVSYINSVKDIQINKADLPPRATDSIEGYDGAVVTQNTSDEVYVPKVRKMSNSTRAKEMRAKRRKKKKKQPEFTYSVESPDGIYTNPEKKKRKFIVKREEENKKFE